MVAGELERVVWVYSLDDRLTQEDANDISDHVPNVIRAAVTYAANMVLRNGQNELSATVIAADHMDPRAELSALAKWPLDHGSLITQQDDLARAPVAVIGGPVRDALFGPKAQPLNEHFQIRDQIFRVKGILAPHPPFVDVEFPDPARVAAGVGTRVYVPFRTGTHLLFGEGANLEHIRVSVEDQTRIDDTAEAIRERLEDRHGSRLLLEILGMPSGTSP